MTNYQQYCHKMAEFQLSALEGMDEAAVQERIVELARECGVVQSVHKLGDELPKGKSYLISFGSKEDAQRAVYAMGAKPFNETSVVLTLH